MELLRTGKPFLKRLGFRYGFAVILNAVDYRLGKGGIFFFVLNSIINRGPHLMLQVFEFL